MRPIIYISEPNTINWAREVAENISHTMQFDTLALELTSLSDINNTIEQHDAAILIFGLDNTKQTQKYLNALRDIRIPYIFVKNGQTFDLKKISLPINYLMEEKEKGPYTSSFARYYNSEITIYKPKDYGTKAQQNINSITTLFDSFELKYEIINGKKDSTKIEFEALEKSSQTHDLIIIGASRDYGLDDIIFGPKERKLINKSTIAVMLINPRGDLYALCD